MIGVYSGELLIEILDTKKIKPAFPQPKTACKAVFIKKLWLVVSVEGFRANKDDDKDKG